MLHNPLFSVTSVLTVHELKHRPSSPTGWWRSQSITSDVRLSDAALSFWQASVAPNVGQLARIAWALQPTASETSPWFFLRGPSPKVFLTQENDIVFSGSKEGWTLTLPNHFSWQRRQFLTRTIQHKILGTVNVTPEAARLADVLRACIRIKVWPAFSRW